MIADELVIEYDPLPWQAECRKVFYRKGVRNLIVNAGIYTGKTDLFTALMLELNQDNPGKVFWWVAAQDFQIGPFWDKFEPHAKELGARTWQAPYRRATFWNGARLYCVTAKSLGLIASYHPKFMFVDEAAKISDQAANLLIARTAGCEKAVFFSSASPANHWAKWVRWGREGKEAGAWALVECSTEEAGVLRPEEVARIRAGLPEDFARQELDAAILSGAGNVFKQVEKRATGRPRLPGKDALGKAFDYILTYDPAKHQDFGFVSIWRGFRQVRAFRWAQTDYTVQAALVLNKAREYHRAVIVMDAQGPGEGVYEMLRAEAAKEAKESGEPAIQIIPLYVNTNEKKQDLVNKAVMAFEQGGIELVGKEHGEDYAACVAEHAAFTRTRSPSGLVYTYNAPEGGHDDSVTCTLLRFAFVSAPRPYIVTSERAR